MVLIDRLYKINKKDIRSNFADFYITFDLEYYYTKSMFSYILNGKREAGSPKVKTFLNNCLSIYDEHTKNYADAQPPLQELLNQYNSTHDFFVTAEVLQGVVDREVTAIKRALKTDDNSKTANDVRDVLTYDLIIPPKRDIQYIFNSLKGYRELKKRLMRAQIGDGQKTYTVEEIANKTNVDLDTLNHLYKACHKKDDFEKVYQSLIQAQENYDLE